MRRFTEDAKDAATIVVGLPLAFVAIMVATVAHVLAWIAVSAAERVGQQPGARTDT